MASISKRTIRWTTEDGESRTADKYEAIYQTAGIVTGQWADPRAGREAVNAYGERWLVRQMIAPSPAKTWASESGPRTVGGRYSILAILLRAAVKDRVIPASPCVDIKLPKIEPKSALVPISTETVLALREAISPRYRAFVTVGAGTGLRRSELLGLTLDRVAFDFARIRVDRQLSRTSRTDAVSFGPPKTEASTRVIPVAEVVLDAIRDQDATYGHHRSGLLFTTESGSPLTPSTLHAAWKTAAQMIGVQATQHDLRHYFASVQIRGGQSIKMLQALLGHKSAVETWDTYGHLMGDEDDRSRSVIEGVLGSCGHSTGTVNIT